MKHSDFKIGEYFYTLTGKWKCTDIGTRVIIAYQIETINGRGKVNDTEFIFDEYDFPACYVSLSELESNLDLSR